MASLKTVLYLGVCLSAWIITTADENFVPKAENIHWVSLDFKIVLVWTTIPSDHKYTVWYSSKESDWRPSQNCIRISHSECDLTGELRPLDRTYTATIKTEPAELYDDDDYDLDVSHSSYSTSFNPYRETNISVVNFNVVVVNASRVILNITDPLSGEHDTGRQLSIRDILKKNLKYKISYYKSGSTGKRDIISNSTTAEVSKLDAGQSYCFMVAAFIPSRPKSTQQGPWSIQQCTPGDDNVLQELSLAACVGAVFILLTVLVIIVTVTVLCCRRRRQRNTFQSSAPV
ncbi:tissue factor-like [Anoplopoma fimbria]|uniref:tissue factor-like n=1 Tax=Anoplopoma fimbria TaxID=229290 RepID=UPI0023ECC63E|nr:tissue factor-like [Anoplopoma fimbria]